MEHECRINIPLDIVFNILSRLSVKPVCRFKCVSKQWLTLTNDPQFIKTHFEISKKRRKSQNSLMFACSSFSPYSTYSLNFRSPNEPINEHKLFCKRYFKISSSCNGILLLGELNRVPFSSWNPSTGSYEIISTPPDYANPVVEHYGLGYDSVRDEFKVFMATNNSGKLNNQYVFNSRSKSWKKIQDFSLPIGFSIFGPSTVVNGTPHWVLKSYCGGPKRVTASLIVYFDPHEETLKILSHPNVKCNEGGIRLACLGGNLCMIDRQEESIDVWEKRGLSWNKLFAVPRDTYLEYIVSPFNKRISFTTHQYFFYSFKPLCFVGEGDNDVVAVILGVLVIYNMHENLFKITDIPQRYGDDFVCYDESLLSPSVGFGVISRDI